MDTGSAFAQIIGRHAAERCQLAGPRFGRIDGVVWLAGILRERMLFNMTESEWDPVFCSGAGAAEAERIGAGVDSAPDRVEGRGRDPDSPATGRSAHSSSGLRAAYRSTRGRGRRLSTWRRLWA